jgi:predicted NUDIX family NTP pyrophosphohydrolase
MLDGPLRHLGDIRQAGGKLVTAYAAQCDFDPDSLVSNLFEMEWPPRSGRLVSFPEVDAVKWLDLEAARAVMLPSQLPLLDRLAQLNL